MLKIDNLTISFSDNKVVKNISFQIQNNSISGIVGESGSGKSVSSLATIGLLPKSAKIDGEIIFNHVNLLDYSEEQFRSIRGKDIAMIFQEPMSSLNPTLKCGYQVAEILQQHTKLSSSEIKTEVLSLLEKVKLPRPELIYNSYPHEISGGQKQRVMIAMAIACKPKLLIADEPTTALDVTVQKEIILLLKEIQQETKMSILFITHDLGLISEIANNVVVMYKGSIIEQGNAKDIFLNPKENYTKALINSKPTLDKRLKKLPTVIDFIEKNIETALYTNKERSDFHKKIYAYPPLLEVFNLKKEFISKGSWLSKSTTIKAVKQYCI